VTGRFVWGKAGKDTETLDCFFDELGPERSAAIEAVSMDMGPAFDKSARKPGHATNAVICYDPYHVVALGTAALEKVRRQVWQELRHLPDKDAARRFKGARWALLKNPGDLTDQQAVTLRKLKRKGGELWRAYGLKNVVRLVEHRPHAHPAHSAQAQRPLRTDGGRVRSPGWGHRNRRRQGDCAEGGLPGPGYGSAGGCPARRGTSAAAR
jgi:Transposase